MVTTVLSVLKEAAKLGLGIAFGLAIYHKAVDPALTKAMGYLPAPKAG